MYSRISDTLSDVGFNLLLASMTPDQAKKQIEGLQDNPDVVKQLLTEIEKIKPGQKLAVTAAVPPLVKNFLTALMVLAPSAFASEGGLDSLVTMLKNPSNISVEKVNTIQQKSEKTMSQEKKNEFAKLVKETKPGAVLPTPQAVNLKGVKLTPATQGQAQLAQKAVKMLNSMGEQGMGADEIEGLASDFAKMIERAHS
jgi:hypothetical protein